MTYGSDAMAVSHGFNPTGIAGNDNAFRFEKEKPVICIFCMEFQAPVSKRHRRLHFSLATMS